MPLAPANETTDIPPGPEQIASEASPEKPTETMQERVDGPEQKKEEEQPPEVQPAPNPEIPIQQKEAQLETPREEPHPPAPATSAPQAAPLHTAAIAAAPAQGRSAQPSNAVPNWTSQIVALLERNKRYPPAAHARGEHGVAEVFFTLDRSGHLVDSKVMRSSGAASLNAEALALLQRAQPFPPPPLEMAGSQVNLTVPIRFKFEITACSTLGPHPCKTAAASLPASRRVKGPRTWPHSFGAPLHAPQDEAALE